MLKEAIKSRLTEWKIEALKSFISQLKEELREAREELKKLQED